MNLRLRAALIVTLVLGGLLAALGWLYRSALSGQALSAGLAAGSILLAGALTAWSLAGNVARAAGRIAKAGESLQQGVYRSADLAGLSARRDEVGALARLFDGLARQVQARERRLHLLRTVIPVGVKLSAERDFNRLLETIVVESQALTNADAGTLYLVTPENTLRFVIVRNTSLHMTMGGTSGNPISFPEIPLSLPDGSPNHRNVATYAAVNRKRATIPDAYKAEGFDFSGTRAFDARTGYRSTSFMTIPLEGERQQVIGVIQLINAKDPATGAVVPFDPDDVIESLVLLASAALSGYIREEQLRAEIDKLRIEIDRVKQERAVSEITETAYFHTLQDRAKEIRDRRKKD